MHLRYLSLYLYNDVSVEMTSKQELLLERDKSKRKNYIIYSMAWYCHVSKIKDGFPLILRGHWRPTRKDSTGRIENLGNKKQSAK